MNLTTKQSWIDKNLARLAKAKPEVAAPVLDRHVRWMEQRDKRQYLEWGLCFLMVEERELWKYLCDKQGQPYRGIDHWMSSAAPVGRATAYDAKGSIKALKGVPLEQLAQVSRANIKVLRLLPVKGQSDPEILSAAKTQEEKQFRKTARTRFPDSHIEAIEPMKLKPEASQRQKIDEAIAAAMLIYELPNRESALECIAAWFMDAQVDSEDYQGLSHREAYENRTLTPRAQTMAAHV